jgi:1-deoxy-D-xylulose-5-phosphate reductoisomerase
LDFHPPDLEAFPALKLGAEVARRGGTCGAVLNASNEVAVERFLARDLRFTEIPQLCRSMLDAHNFESSPSLTDLLRMDRWTRDEARRWRPLS